MDSHLARLTVQRANELDSLGTTAIFHDQIVAF
jgi:hypothetical protein